MVSWYFIKFVDKNIYFKKVGGAALKPGFTKIVDACKAK